jgi:streptogramin lyase
MRRTSRRTTLALNLVCAALLTSGPLAALQPSFAFAAGNHKAAPSQPAKPPTAAKAQINASYGRLPLSFEPNRGQADRAVDFVARGAGYAVYLSRGSAVLTLTSRSLSLTLVGAASSPQVSGQQELAGKANYLIGKKASDWKVGVPTFARVIYRNVYPGIDLEYYGNQGQLEYDFVVHPGADSSRIQLRLQGADQLKVDNKGELVLQIGGTSVQQRKPAAYQDVRGSRKQVTGGYRLTAPDHLSFQVGAHDPSQLLTIDPTLLYSSFLGGTGQDTAQAIAVDSAHEAFITGQTSSPNFPVTTGAFQPSGVSSFPPPDVHAFVSKLSADGSALVYSTYLGGTAPVPLPVTEFNIPTESGNPTGLVAGPDGNLWFTEVNGNKIGKMTTAGAVTEYSVPTSGSQPFWIAAGSDGNLWFTETSANQIGRITTSGAITGYALAGGSAPNQITPGPAGDPNLWFTEYGANQIATITTAGVITEFPIPTANSGPTGIVAGPDGNVWFTEQLANKIGRRTPSGVITEFPLAAGTTPAHITQGPGPGLWFTELDANKIGNITTAGAVAEFTIPTSESQPGDIAAGPDGNLWFTQQALNGIGRITPAGVVTESDSIPSGSQGHGNIVTGPDGNIWFAEEFGNRIGQVAPRTNDLGNSIAVDTTGDAYIAGATNSTDFPTTAGAFQATFPATNQAAFAAELNPSGNGLVYSTFLGGNTGATSAQGIAIDATGAYVTGQTNASNFPTTGAAVQATYPGGVTNAFITKLNPTGSAEVYSTFLGGGEGGTTSGQAIALDSSGEAFVTGSTSSGSFPTTSNAYQTTLQPSATNAFVTQLNPTGSALLYSSYLGGAGLDNGLAIAVDGSARAYLTGTTCSTDFPTPPSTSSVHACTIPIRAFVSKVDPGQSGPASLVYSKFLAPVGADAEGIAVDGMGRAWVTGATASTSFPTVDSIQATNAGGADAFLARLSSDGASIEFSTYLGGAGNDRAHAIALDSIGGAAPGAGWRPVVGVEAYIAGDTNSANFPTVGAVQGKLAGEGSVNAFISKVGFPIASPPSRGNYAIVYDSDRHVTVLFGGYNGANPFGQNFYGDTWEYDGQTWRNVPSAEGAPPPFPRYDASMVYSPTEHRMILFGGWVPCGSAIICAAGDTWEYDGTRTDGTNWIPMHPASAPPPRAAFGMAMDTQRGKAVVFGGDGINGVLLNDTWEWDGSNWHETVVGSPAFSAGSNCTSGSLPDPRAFFSLAYDSNHGQTVLFSGTTGICDFNDTWLYDGNSWQKANPEIQPHARGNYAVAFDAARGKTVLMGGCFAGTVFADTWVWDGANWVDRSAAYGTPGGRFNVSMAYDSARQKSVLFAGTNLFSCSPTSTTSLADTWELSTAGTATTPPPARTLAANLQMTVDEPTIPAGASLVTLANVPGGRVPGIVDSPATSPLSGIPLSGIPLSGIPLSGIPLSGIPLSGIPLSGIPLSGIALGTSPIGNFTLGALGLANSFNGTNGLDNVLISSLPAIDWNSILSGTTLAGLPPQSVTLKQVFAAAAASGQPTPSDKLNPLALKSSGLGGSLLRGTPISALLLGNLTLDKIPVPEGQSSWCAELQAKNPSFSCPDPTSTTLLGLSIAGAPLSGIPIGADTFSTPATVPPTGIPLSGIPLSGIPLSGIAITSTPLSGIPLSGIPVGVVDCTKVNCTGTLGDAYRANAFVPGATLGQLGALLNNITIGELVAGLVPIGDLSWEKFAIDGVQDFAPVTPAGLHYHVNFDVTCPGETSVNLGIQAVLPQGFRYMPNSSTFSVGTAAAQAAPDPSGAPGPLTDTPSTLSWNSFPSTVCGPGIASTHVALNFQSQPGLDLGQWTSSATVRTPGPLAATNQAPVQVTENLEPNDTPTTGLIIQPDQLVIAHIADAGAVDFFRLLIPAQKGTRLTFLLSHIPFGADFDLVIGKPTPASLQSNPLSGIPLSGIPFADNGAGTDNSSTVLPSETLADIPLSGIPLSGIPLSGISVAGVSQNRGSVDEMVQIVAGSEAGSGGFYTIQVTGYNQSFSSRPYVLRVKETAPVTLPTCLPLTLPNSFNIGLPSTSNISSKTTLFLVNQNRMADLYGGQAATAGMLTSLYSVAQRAGVNGLVVPVDGSSAVRTAYATWDQNPCSVDAANNVVRQINGVVAQYRASAKGLKWIVMVGSDQALPMARIPDLTTVSNESNEALDLSFLTRGSPTGSNALYAAEATGNFLTDDAYVSFINTQYLGHELYLPTISAGRLVESPGEIKAQLDQYTTFNGQLNPTTALTSGYDFLTDGAQSVDAALSNHSNPPNRFTTAGSGLISDSWDRTNLLCAYATNLTALSGCTPPPPAIPDIGSLNAHYNHFELLPAQQNTNGTFSQSQLVTTADLQQTLAGKILFTMGCHGGANVPDTLLTAPTTAESTRLLDWPQAYAQKLAAVYIANTGYGYGDTLTVGLSERLMSLLASQLGDPNNNLSIGERLVYAKQNYFQTIGTYGIYDEKALVEATFYGLPMYHLPTGGTPPPPVFQLPAPDPSGVSGLSIVPVSIAPTLSGPINTGRGTYWTGPNGQTQATFYRPIEPRVDQDVTAQSSSAHGFIVKSLTTDDTGNITPALAYPTVDLSSHEPAPNFQDDLYPANFTRIDRSNTFGAERDRLVLIAGQFRPNNPPTTNSGTQRLVRNIGGDVLYSTSGNFTPPLISLVNSVRNGTSVTILVRATSSAGVKRASVLFHQAGVTGWTYQELSAVAGTDRWTATVTLSSANDIELFAQVQDVNGNVGYSTNKGFLFQSVSSDHTPPVTTATPSAGPSFGNFSVVFNISSATLTPAGGIPQSFGPLTCWLSPSVVVNLRAADEAGGSGVKQVNYSLSGAQTKALTVVSGSSTTVTISAPGMTTITYFSTDFAGNVETAKSLTLFVSSAGFSCSPATSVTIPAHGTLTVVGTITITNVSTGSVTTFPFDVTFSF